MHTQHVNWNYSEKMVQKGWIKFLLKFSYRCCSFFGLIPFHWNKRTRKFETSWYDKVYSGIICIAFLYFYRTSGLSTVAVLNPLVVIAFFYLNMSLIFITFTIQCFNAEKLANYLNKLKQFLKKLTGITGFERSKHSYRKPIILLLFKTIVVNLMAQSGIILACSILGQIITGRIDYFVVFIVSYAYFLQTIVPNIFYAIVLGAEFYLKLLNDKINDVINKNAKFEQKKSQYSYYEMDFVADELCKKLDQIAIYHAKLTAFIVIANKIFSVQLLGSITNFVGILLIEVC